MKGNVWDIFNKYIYFVKICRRSEIIFSLLNLNLKLFIPFSWRREYYSVIYLNFFWEMRSLKVAAVFNSLIKTDLKKYLSDIDARLRKVNEELARTKQKLRKYKVIL